MFNGLDYVWLIGAFTIGFLVASAFFLVERSL